MQALARDRLAHGTLLFLSALWCGALTFFAGLGARIVLYAATSKNAAAPINRALLDALDIASAVLAVLLLVCVFLLKRQMTPGRFGIAIRLIVLGGAAAVASHTVITPQMMAVRAKMPMLIDLLSKDDPARKAWGRLHAMSSLALGVRILAAAGLFAAAYSVKPRRTLGLLTRDEEDLNGPVDET